MVSRILAKFPRIKNNESGQAGLEFVVITPVFLLSIALLGMLGRMVYMKLASQSFAYSNCAWVSRVSPIDTANIGGFVSHHDAYKSYKATWLDQSAWEEGRAAMFGLRDVSVVSGGGVAGEVWLFGDMAPVDGEGYFQTMLTCYSPPVASPQTFDGGFWK